MVGICYMGASKSRNSRKKLSKKARFVKIWFLVCGDSSCDLRIYSKDEIFLRRYIPYSAMMNRVVHKSENESMSWNQGP